MEDKFGPELPIATAHAALRHFPGKRNACGTSSGTCILRVSGQLIEVLSGTEEFSIPPAS